GRFTHIGSNILQILSGGDPPDPGKIRLPIRGFRRRSAEIGLAIGQARRIRKRKADPLCKEQSDDHLPTRCLASRSFSQTLSMISLSGKSSKWMVTFHGRV